ncbi:MAG: hypothetical protein WCT51_00350 [Candidatus Shapirobacteria bacterium]|jgi:hypothetical protein
MSIKDKGTWVIKLPAKAKLLVEVGDKVDVGQKLAIFNSHVVETFSYSGDLAKMSERKRGELDNFFKEKMVQEGEIFYEIGFFKNKICFPLTGVCLGFDEFKNLKIEKVEDEEREIFSPIEARVGKIEDGKLVLEFKAKEYEGQGLNGLKAWGEGEVKIIDEVKFLDYEMDDNILFTTNLNRAFLLKAQVVGVKAVVVKNNDEVKEVDMDVPVLRLEEQIWNEFMKENLGKKKKILVNAKMDRLLLVLE